MSEPQMVCANPDCHDPVGVVQAIEVWVTDDATGEEVHRAEPSLCEGCRREILGLSRRPSGE